MGRGQTAKVGDTRVSQNVLLVGPILHAYLAGQMDADGSIGIYAQGRTVGGTLYPSVIVRVTYYSQDENVLWLFKDNFGGIITRSPGCWYWLLTGSYLPFLDAIIPYMVTKKEQAELVRTYKMWVAAGGSRGTTPEKRFWFVDESKRLNALVKETFNG